jgi:uncharacterized protein
MKKIIYSLFFWCIALAAIGQESFDPDQLLKKPAPGRLVNDYTNTLTPDQLADLEGRLQAFDKESSTQIAVVLVPTLNGRGISDYNVELGRAWGVGNKKYNNGVVLLIAKQDRKMDIAVGYGLEGELTDLTAQQIITQEIRPRFKAEDFYGGIKMGTAAIIKAVQGKYKAPPGYGKKDGGFSLSKIIFIIIIIIVILSIFGGGNNGSFMSRRGATGWSGPIFWGGGGSGGGGGGSSGGGGFGGFGGGSFGGGGASGDW